MDTRSGNIRNIFDFPSETNTRFFLLILAALFFAVNTGQNIGRSISVLTGSSGIVSGEPEYSSPTDKNADDGNLRTYEENVQYNKEVFVNSFKSLSFQMLSVMLLFATACYIYRTYPKRIVRKNKLRPFDYSGDEFFFRSMLEISKTTGTSVPQSYSGSLFTSTTAQAFGYSKQYFLRIDNGLRIVLRRSKNAFDAIMLHEFGHIINRDIFKTYFTQSLWYACLIVFIVPLIIISFMNFFSGVFARFQTDGYGAVAFLKILTVSLPALIKVLIQYTALILVIAYTRSSLLRTREFYADQRAVQYGASENLIALFEKNTEGLRAGFIKRVFMLHPDSKARIEAIRNNNILFRMKGELAFITGLLIAITINGLFYPFMSSLLFVSSIFGFGTNIESVGVSYFVIMMGFIIPGLLVLILGFIISMLISGTIGIQIVKDSFAEGNNDTVSKFKKYLTSSSLFVLGNETGFLIVPFSSIIALNAGAFLLIILLQVLFAMILCISFAFMDYIGIKMLQNASARIKTRMRMASIFNSLCLSVFVVIYFSARVYIVQNY